VRGIRNPFWNTGFTIVELAIAIALGSIIVASAVPQLNRMQQAWALWGTAQLVETSLQWGKMHAVTANTSMAFQVSEDGRRYSWADPLSGMEYEGTIRYLPPGVSIVDKPAKSLRFFQKGNAAPAGTFVVKGDAGIWRVVVNPAGRIRIQKG
jgi:prepilin-type N-terminal cleavage/methylation domain-containing protein